MLGSAGGPRQALPLVGADTFLIVNGDTLTDVDLAVARRGAPAARARSSRSRSSPTASRTGTAASSSTPSRRRDRIRRPRAGGGGLVSFHRRAGRRRRRRSTACRRDVAANSIGGVYDALHGAPPRRDPRLRVRARRSGTSARSPTTGDLGGAGERAASRIGRDVRVDADRPRRRRRSCGTMSRSARDAVARRVHRHRRRAVVPAGARYRRVDSGAGGPRRCIAAPFDLS